MNAALIDLAVRSSVILVAGLLLAASMWRRAAALRHLVLAATVAAAALVAPLQLLVPAWDVPVPAARPAPSASQAPVPALLASPAAAVGAPAPAIPGRPPVLAILWVTGVIAAGASLVAALARLRRIAAGATQVTAGSWIRLTAAIAADYGITRRIVLLQTGAPALLATFGALRPRVLLPAGAAQWPDDRIRVVLSHELAHVRRNDWAVQIAAEAIKAVLWFNPLAWLACARLRRESERACDDAVLGLGVAPRDYAGHLLDLARTCRAPGLLRAATPMSQSLLEGRIAAMLNPRLDRRPVSRPALAAAGALLLALALPTAALRARQAAPDTLAGTVYDATGGVLPGVEFVLDSADLIVARVKSDASGHFVFKGVQPGPYTLTASLPGFRSLEQKFDLVNPRDWDRAITLQVGDLRESITVRETRLAPAARGPEPRAAEPVRIGGNVRAPRKELDVKPVYPPAMRAAGREGVVPIEAVIGRDGMVSMVRVLSAEVHPDFAIAAADAVRQWRFTPTLLNGVAVEVVMTVSVRFDLAN